MNDYFRDQLSEISDEWQNYTSTYVYANNFSGTAPYFVEITDSTPEDIEIGMNINIQLTLGTKVVGFESKS